MQDRKDLAKVERPTTSPQQVERSPDAQRALAYLKRRVPSFRFPGLPRELTARSSDASPSRVQKPRRSVPVSELRPVYRLVEPSVIGVTSWR